MHPALSVTQLVSTLLVLALHWYGYSLIDPGQCGSGARAARSHSQTHYTSHTRIRHGLEFRNQSERNPSAQVA